MIQIDMKMPASCNSCECKVFHLDMFASSNWICGITKEKIKVTTYKRDKNCKLIEVKE